MTPELKEHLEAWFEKAEHDLLSAQRLIEIEPAILDTACFHCQQAVEKYLKAFILYNDIDPEKTHNLDKLFKKCGEFDEEFNQIDAMDLNSYAVSIRYPDLSELPELGEVRSYYKLALNIKEIVLAKIDLTIAQEQHQRRRRGR